MAPRSFHVAMLNRCEVVNHSGDARHGHFRQWPDGRERIPHAASRASRATRRPAVDQPPHTERAGTPAIAFRQLCKVRRRLAQGARERTVAPVGAMAARAVGLEAGLKPDG